MDLDILFSAKSFAVVGASSDPSKVGHQILKNLAVNKDLTLYPINLKGGTILGYPVYPHIGSAPTTPDVVIICVPLAVVSDVVDECIKVHPRAVVLITSGFAEVGETGKILQTTIIKILSDAGIALLGPNSMGYLVPSQGIYASFGPSDVEPGKIAVISQSGAMLSALFQEYASSNTGISFALSLGNMTGYDENDALVYALHDEQTKVIAIYLESLANPQTFLSLAAQVSHIKPIFLLKGGTTKEGSQAALSHTAALATSQVLLDSLCLQAGIVQVANFEQLVRASVAASKSHYLPDNLLIITNAGGPGVVLTDEIIKAGIPLSRPPLDLLGDATPQDFEQALSTLDLSLDTIVVIVTQQAVTDLAGITKVLARKRGVRLLFVCLAGGDELEIYRTQLKKSGVIVTRYPNEIAETLELLYKAKLAQAQNKFPSYTVTGPTRPFPISYQDTVKLLEEYGFKTPKSIIIYSEADLPKLKDLSYPLIAKTTSLELKHKAKVGAVILDIIDSSSSLVAYQKLTQWGTDVVFQEKITTKVEVLLGAHHDPIWGWYLAIGLGGSLSDTYDDRVYLFLPVDATQIAISLQRTKLSSLLNESQTKLLVASILKFASLVLETKGLNELEINPLFVTDHALVAADLKRS